MKLLPGRSGTNFFRELRSTAARIIAPKEVVTRRFDAASGGRRWEHRPSFSSYGPEVGAARAQIQSRARNATVNMPHAANAVGIYETALAGFGIKTVSTHPNRAVRRAVASIFAKWAKRADADGLTSWEGIQASVVRALVIDGEAWIHIVNTPDGPKLRQLPAEQIDSSRSSLAPMADGSQDIEGVRIAADGTRLGYWVFPNRPDPLRGLAESVLIPASDMLHVFKPLGPGAVRGVSWFAPVLLALSEHDQWADAQLVANKIQSMLVGFFLDQNGTGAPFEGEDFESLSLEPGTMRRLPAGWDVKFSNPQQAAQAIEYGAFSLRTIAAGLQIPDWMLSGDMRSVNYSSARSAMVSWRQRVEQVQHHTLAPQLLEKVFARVVTWAVLSGQLDAPDFESSADEYLACEHYPPAQPWVDPKKDADAQVAMVAAGFKSRRQVVAELGYEIEDLDAERAADAEREASLGLTEPSPSDDEDSDVA